VVQVTAMSAKKPNWQGRGTALALEGLTLQGIRFFEGIETEVVNAFSTAAIWQRFNEGQMIFDQESDGMEVHFVFQGCVRLLTSVDGGEPVTLAEVGTGDIFGELAAIDHLGRSARALAVNDTILASIHGPVFVKLLEDNPKVAARMLKRLAGIIRSMDVRLTNIAVLTPIQRVIAELMRRAEPDVRVPGMWIIPFAPSHGDIASWAGLDREQVAQTIGALAREALLRRRGGSLVLMDWAALQSMVKPAHTRRDGSGTALDGLLKLPA
jgi:CRP/FNR family transcriptional regulator, cyclic AMP receptor protein